jgi:chromosome segregation ATPase
MTPTLTAEQIGEQVEELRACEGVGLRQDGLHDRFQDAASTIETLQRRAEAAESEVKGLLIQVDAMARIGAAREKQFAEAREERGRLRSHNWTLAESLTNANRAADNIAQERDALCEEVSFWRSDLAARLALAVGIHKHAVKTGDAARAADIRVSVIMPGLAALRDADAKEWHSRCDFCGELIRPEDEQQASGYEDIGPVHRRCGNPDEPDFPEGSGWQEKAIEAARAIVGIKP